MSPCLLNLVPARRRVVSGCFWQLFERWPEVNRPYVLSVLRSFAGTWVGCVLLVGTCTLYRRYYAVGKPGGTSVFPYFDMKCLDTDCTINNTLAVRHSLLCWVARATVRAEAALNLVRYVDIILVHISSTVRKDRSKLYRYGCGWFMVLNLHFLYPVVSSERGRRFCVASHTKCLWDHHRYFIRLLLYRSTNLHLHVVRSMRQLC